MALRVTPVLVEGGAEFAEVRELSQARRTRGWAGLVKCGVESRVEARSTSSELQVERPRAFGTQVPKPPRCSTGAATRKSLHSVAQHNIFELALTPDDEDSSHSSGEIKLQTIQIYLNASTCKERNNYLNETDLRKYQLSNCCTSGLWNCPSH
jgi:hypothetical protein